MKVRTVALLVTLWLGCVALAAAQPAPQGAGVPGAEKGKLGYGFAPGLVAGKDYVAGQLIVGLKEGMSTQGLTTVLQTASAAHGQMVKELQGTALLLAFPSEPALLDAVNQLITLPQVAFVERNGFMGIPPTPRPPVSKGSGAQKMQKSSSGGDLQPQAVSADKGTGYQWHLTVIRKTAALPALAATPPTVAVIDTGVDYLHSDLVGKVIKGKNSVANNLDPFDDNEHGTHVAGLIGAIAGNTIYGEGVCPNCKILAVKVLNGAGFGSFFDIADGMAWVVANRNTTVPPTRVVNMSLGGPNSALVAAQVLAMKNAGMVLVAAAGNSNTTATTFAFPGADPNVALRVMATEENDARASFSNFSPSGNPTQYNLAAPGFQIFSTVPGEGFTRLSGTSMATPITAGAAALVWGQLPALTRDQLVSRLVTNGKLISKGFAASTRRLDVRKAITATAETGLVGRILDPFLGRAPSPDNVPVTASLLNGATQVGVDPTNKGGSYEMIGQTAGARTLRGARAGNPTTSLKALTLAAGVVAGPYTDALPQARPTGHATIIMDWLTTQPVHDTPGCLDTCNGWEVDLFVKSPSGTYVGFDNPGDLTGAPFMFFPRDSFDDAQPLETIVIGPAAANGVYKVFLDNTFAGGAGSFTAFNPSWTGSLAAVQVFNGSTGLAIFASPPATCGTNEFWYVGNLTKTSSTAYTWTTVNTCSNVLP